MNRYPLWKYSLIAVAMVVGILYTLPNFFPEVPAVQISTSKTNIKIDAATLQTAEDALKDAARRWYDDEYRPVVAMLHEADLVGRGTEAEAYLRVACDRYRLIRAHEWSYEIVALLRGPLPGRRA